MRREEFIERVRRGVYDSSIDGIISLLVKPPGRKPSRVLTELSDWYNQLSHVDKVRVRTTIQLAVRDTVFGMLAVLDGDRTVNESGETGILTLNYAHDRVSILLNDPTKEPLHDLFAAQVPPM